MSYEINNNNKRKHHHHKKNKNKKNKKNNNSYNKDDLFDDGEKLYNFEDVDIEEKIKTKRESTEDHLEDLMSKNDDFGIKLNLTNNNKKNNNNGIKIISDKDSVITNYNKNLSDKNNSSLNDFKMDKIHENKNDFDNNNKNDNKNDKNDNNFLMNLNNLNVFKELTSNNSNSNDKKFIVGKE